MAQAKQLSQEVPVVDRLLLAVSLPVVIAGRDLEGGDHESCPLGSRHRSQTASARTQTERTLLKKEMVDVLFC